MTAEQVARKEEEGKNEEPSPEGTNLELRKDFFAIIDELRKKNMDKSKDFRKSIVAVPIDASLHPSHHPFPSHVLLPSLPFTDAIRVFCFTVHHSQVNTLLFHLSTVLHLLCVTPTHQRQGLGGLLVSDGLAVADERNAQTYIEASTKGLGLYLKHGWEPIDEIVVDMGSYGGKGVEREKCLMRQPRGNAG